MCPLPSYRLRPESELITEGCEYWREGVEHSKFPSSLLECGDQFIPSPDEIRWNSYHFQKTAENGSGCNNREDVAINLKLSHNEKERQRRKKLNALYAKLQSLLPQSHSNMKKIISNPAIVCRALKYISQLLRMIETLSRQRNELLSLKSISEHAVALKPSPAHATAILINEEDFNEFPVAISPQVSIFEAGPVLLIKVQTVHAAPLLFSRLLLLFEEEKLDVMNASTFVSDEKAWHSIQVKALENWRVDTTDLHLKILHLSEESRFHFVQQSTPCF